MQYILSPIQNADGTVAPEDTAVGSGAVVSNWPRFNPLVGYIHYSFNYQSEINILKSHIKHSATYSLDMVDITA